MKNLREFALELEGGKIAYLPGDVLHGELFLCLKKPLDIKCMKILLRGEGQGAILQQALASERKQDGDISDDERNHATSRKEPKIKDEVVYKNSNKKLLLVDIRLVIFGKDGARDDELETHASGRYAYEFEFDIPKNLPSTFKSPPEKNLGFIGYHLKAVIQRPNKHDKITKMRIVINHPLDPTRPELAYQPGSNVNKEISSGCVPAGTLAFEGYLNQSVYKQGGKILINAVADNGSTRLMKEIYAKLIRRVCYKARFGTKVYTQDAASAHGPRVPPHKAVAWKNRPMRIPAVGPSIGGDVDVKVDYIVRVGMYEEMGSEIHVDLPVVIGTTSEDDKSDTEKPARKKNRPGLHLVKAYARDKHKEELQARLRAIGGKQADGKGLYSDLWWHQRHALQDGEHKLRCEEPLIATVDEDDMYANMDESAYLDALAKQGKRDDSRRRPTTPTDAPEKKRPTSSGTGGKGTAFTASSALGEAMHGNEKLNANPVSRVAIPENIPEGMGGSGFLRAGRGHGTFAPRGIQMSTTGPEKSSRDLERSNIEKGSWRGEGPQTYYTGKDIPAVSSKKRLPKKKEREMLSQGGTGESTGPSAILHHGAAARSMQSPNNMLDQRLAHGRQGVPEKGISHGEDTYDREPLSNAVNDRTVPESKVRKYPLTGKEPFGIHESPIIPSSPLHDANASVDEEAFLKEFEKLEETFRSESPSRNTQFSTGLSTATDRAPLSVSVPKRNQKQESGIASSKRYNPEPRSSETEPVSAKLSGERVPSEVSEDFSRKKYGTALPQIVPEVMTTGDRNYDREQRPQVLKPEEISGKQPPSKVKVEPELQFKIKESGAFHPTNKPFVGESLHGSNENQLMTGENKPRHTAGHPKPQMLEENAEGDKQRTYPAYKGPFTAKKGEHSSSDLPSAPYLAPKREKSDAVMPTSSSPQSETPRPSEFDSAIAARMPESSGDAQHEKIYPSLSLNEKADLHAPDHGARAGPGFRSETDLQQLTSKSASGDAYFLNPFYSNSEKRSGDGIQSGFKPSEIYSTTSISPVLARSDPSSTGNLHAGSTSNSDGSQRLASESVSGHLKEGVAELSLKRPGSAAGSRSDPLAATWGPQQSQNAELNSNKMEGVDTEAKHNVAEQQRKEGFAKRAWEKVKRLIPKISKGVDSSTSPNTGLKEANSEIENKDSSIFASAEPRGSVDDKTLDGIRLRDNIETNISLSNAEGKDRKTVRQLESTTLPGFMMHEPLERPKNMGSVPTKDGLQSSLRLTDAPTYQPSSKESESYGKARPYTKASNQLMLSSTERYLPEISLDDTELQPSHAYRNNESGDSEVVEHSSKPKVKERRLQGMANTNRNGPLNQGRTGLASKPPESAPPELCCDEPEATLDDLVQRRVSSPLPAAVKRSRSKNKSSSQPAGKDLPSDHTSKNGDETSLLDHSGIVTELGRIDDLFDLKASSIGRPSKLRTHPRQISKPSIFLKTVAARPLLVRSNKLSTAESMEKRIGVAYQTPSAIAGKTKDAPSLSNAGTVSKLRSIQSGCRPGTLSKATSIGVVDNERYRATGRDVRVGFKVKKPGLTLAPKTGTDIKAKGLERPRKAKYHSTRGLPLSYGRKLSPRSSLARISKRPLETTRRLQLQSQAIAEVSEERENLAADGKYDDDDNDKHIERDKGHLLAPYYKNRGRADYPASPKTLNMAAKAPITGKISKKLFAKEENRNRASGSRLAGGKRDQEENSGRVARSSTAGKHSGRGTARDTADESSINVAGKISPPAKKQFALQDQKKRTSVERANKSAPGLIKSGTIDDKRPVVKVPWVLTKSNPGILGSPTFRNVSMKPALPSKKAPRSRIHVKHVEEEASQKDNLTYTLEGCKEPDGDSAAEIDELSDMENDGNLESGSSATKLGEHGMWKRSGTQVSTAVKQYKEKARDLLIREQKPKRSSSLSKGATQVPSTDTRRSSGSSEVVAAKELALFEKPTEETLLPRTSGHIPDRNTISKVQIEHKDKTQIVDDDSDSDRGEESRAFMERKGPTLANHANEAEDTSATNAMGTLKDEDIQSRLPFSPIPEQTGIFSKNPHSFQGSDARMKSNDEGIRSKEPVKAKNRVQGQPGASAAQHMRASHKDKSNCPPAKTLHTSSEAPGSISRHHRIRQLSETASLKPGATRVLAKTFLKGASQTSDSGKTEEKDRSQAKQEKRPALKPEKMEGSKNRSQPSLGLSLHDVHRNGRQPHIKMIESIRREEESKDDLRDDQNTKETPLIEERIEEQDAAELHQPISLGSRQALERPLKLPTPIVGYPKQLPMIASYPLPEPKDDRKFEWRLGYQGMAENDAMASPKAVANVQGITSDTNQQTAKGSMPGINGGYIKPLVAQLPEGNSPVPGRKSKRPQQESAIPKKATKTWRPSISTREGKGILKAPSYAQRSRVKKKRPRKAHTVMNETTKLLLPAHPESATYKHPEYGTCKNDMQDFPVVFRESAIQPQVYRERSRIWQHSHVTTFSSSHRREEDRTVVSKMSLTPHAAMVKSPIAGVVATAGSSVESAGIARQGTTSPHKQLEKGISKAAETHHSRDQATRSDIYYASNIVKLPGQANLLDSDPGDRSSKTCVSPNISEIPTGEADSQNNRRIVTRHMPLHPRRARSVSPQNTERSRSEKRSRSSSPNKCGCSDDIEADPSHRVNIIQTPPIPQNNDKASVTNNSREAPLAPSEYFERHMPRDTRVYSRPTVNKPYEIGRYSVLYDVVPEVSEEESATRSSIKDKNSGTTRKQPPRSDTPSQNLESPRGQGEVTTPRDHVIVDSRGPVLPYVGHIERLDEQKKVGKTNAPANCVKQEDSEKGYSSDQEVSIQANTSSDADLSWIFPLDAPENLKLPAPPTHQTPAKPEEQKMEIKQAESSTVTTRAAMCAPITKESLVSQIEEKIERMHKQLDQELGIVEKSRSPILRAEVSDTASRANPGGIQKIVSATNSQPVLFTYVEPSRSSFLEAADLTEVETQSLANAEKAEVRVSSGARLSSESRFNDESAIIEVVPSRKEPVVANANQTSATSAKTFDLGRPTADFLKNETEVIRDKYYGGSGGALFSRVRPGEYGVQGTFSKINKGSQAKQLSVHDDRVVISGIRDAPFQVKTTSPSKLKKREAPSKPPKNQSNILIHKNARDIGERASLKLIEPSANAHAKPKPEIASSTPSIRVIVSSGTRNVSSLATQSSASASRKRLPPKSAPMPKQGASTTETERHLGVEREIRERELRMSKAIAVTPVDNQGKDLNRIATQKIVLEAASGGMSLSPSKNRFDPATKADTTDFRQPVERRDNSAIGTYSATTFGKSRVIIGTDAGRGKKAFACDEAERSTSMNEVQEFSGSVLSRLSTRRHDRADSFDLHELTFGIVDQHGRVVNKERLITGDDDLRSKDLVLDERLLQRSRSTEPKSEKTHNTHIGEIKSRPKSQRHVTKVTLINFADHLRSLKEGKRWSSCPAEIGQREGIYVVEDRSTSISTDDQAEAPEDDVLDYQHHRRLHQSMDGTTEDVHDGIQTSDDGNHSVGTRQRMRLIAGGKDLEALVKTRSKDQAGTSTGESENMKKSSIPSRSAIVTPVQNDQVSYRIMKPSKSRTATYARHLAQGGIISATDIRIFGCDKPVAKREVTEERKIGSFYWKSSSNNTPGSSEMRDRVEDHDLQFAWYSGRPVDSVDGSTESLSGNNTVLKSKEVGKTLK